MNGWVVIGECYVKPIDWEELWLITPEGAQYACYRHHTQGGQKILIGTAPTPRAAAKLALDAVHRAVGAVVNQDEVRIAHGMAPRLHEPDLMPSPAVRERVARARALGIAEVAASGGGGAAASYQVTASAGSFFTTTPTRLARDYLDRLEMARDQLEIHVPS